MIILRERAHKNFAKIPKRRKKKEQLNGETVKSRTVHNYFHIGRGYSFTPGVWKILWLSGERTGSKPFPGLLTAYVFASVSKHWQFIRARKGGGSNPIDIAIEYRWGSPPPPTQDRSRFPRPNPLLWGFLCLFVGVFSVVRLLASVTAHSPPRIYRIAYSRSVHPVHGRNVCAFRDHPGK